MWMGISTNGIGKISMPVAPSTPKDTVQQDGSSFADIMELSSKGNATNDAKNVSPKVAINNDVNTQNESKDIDSASKSTDSVNKFEQQDNVEVREEQTTVNEVADDDKTESLKEVIKKAIDKIYDVLEEKLGCTEKDIDDMLENMSMMLQDLLVPNNLRNFVLQFNNATEVDLLISEQLPNLVADIQNAISDILEEFGVTEEDITNFLDDLQAGLAETVEENDNASNEDIKTQDATVTADEETTANLEQKIDLTSAATESNGTDTNTGASEDQSLIAANLNQALNQVVGAEQTEAINNFQGDVAQADIIRQVVEAVRVNLSQDSTSMTLQLNPENLGRVQISVIQKNGIMQAQIIAENEAAKNAIESNLALLQESLDHQELKVESVEVMIASYEFFNQQEQQSNEQNSNQTNRSSNINGLEAVDEIVEDDVLEEQIMKAQGNSVNYSI